MATGTPGAEGTPPPAEVKLMNFSGDKGPGASVKLARADVPPLVVEDSPDYWHRRALRQANPIVDDKTIRDRFWAESEKLIASALAKCHGR